MLVTVVVLFGVCWLPLHLFNVHQDLVNSGGGGGGDDAVNSANDDDDDVSAATGDDSNGVDDKLFVIYMAVHWLAMSNSFVNPVIYGFLNDGFRVSYFML